MSHRGARREPYDVVLIGAGVRVLPAHFLLFERLINAVHEAVPQAKLCFNTRPDDTQEVVLRWIAPPADPLPSGRVRSRPRGRS